MKRDLERKSIEPEEFTDGIIFMSMFNDIDWTTRGNDEICISNAEKSCITRINFRIDTGRFWVLDRKRSCIEDFCILPMENGTPQLI